MSTLIILLLVLVVILSITWWVNQMETFYNSKEWNEHKNDPEYWDTNYPWP